MALVQYLLTDALQNNMSEVAPTNKIFTFNLPNKTLASNCLIITILHNQSRTIVVSDDKGNVYDTVNKKSVTDTGGTVMTLEMVAAYGIAADTQLITVTYSTNPAQFDCIFKAEAVEFSGVATSSAFDTGWTSNAGTLAAIAAGSQTPGTGGDLIYQVAVAAIGGGLGTTTKLTGFTAGANFTLLTADLKQGWASQYQIQSGNPAINPTLTMSGSNGDPALTVALALKSAVAGNTPPTGIRVVGILNVQIPQKVNPTLCLNAVGNLVALLTDGTFTQFPISAVTDGTAWTVVSTTDTPQGAHRANVTPGPYTITLTCDTTAVICTVSLFDIAGAKTAPFDVSAVASNVNTPPSPAPHCPDITPTTALGLVIARISLGVGPTTAVSPGVLIGVDYAWKTDAGTDNGGDAAVYYNPTASAENWQWTCAQTSSNGALALAFMAAVSAPTPAIRRGNLLRKRFAAQLD